MARPVQASAEATRQKIVSSAASLFSERGHGATSMRDIARASGVSQATIHHYFGGKDALYRSCVAAMRADVDALRDEIVPLFGQGFDFDELFAQCIRRAFQFAVARKPALRLMMRHVIDAGSVEGAWRDGVLLPFLDMGRALLGPFSILPEDSLRLSIHSAQALLIRYALSEANEWESITGASGEAARAAIEEHLILAIRRLLGLAVGG